MSRIMLVIFIAAMVIAGCDDGDSSSSARVNPESSYNELPYGEPDIVNQELLRQANEWVFEHQTQININNAID